MIRNRRTVSTKSLNLDTGMNLGDGLILREATARDAETLSVFNAEIHRQVDTGTPDSGVAALTRDLMSGKHPGMGPEDFLVVENTRDGEIVSSLCLVPQVWSYGGVKVKVGRPELVGTHPEYRGRGLVRTQFEIIHHRSAQRGQKIQAIAGIPYFYRQFGYEMALELDGGRVGYAGYAPTLKEGDTEPYCLRPARKTDLPFLVQVYKQTIRRYLVTCIYDEASWQYELFGRSTESVNRSELRIIETLGGELVGFLAHPPHLWDTKLAITAYELMPGISWLAVTPSVIQYLQTTGETYAIRDGRGRFEALTFRLGTEHPVYQVMPKGLSIVQPPYAFYIRVPDLPDFLRHVAPVLERRLEASALIGHTGELKISFYRDGLRLAFEHGHLAEVKRWIPTGNDRGSAAFPGLTFLQMLFGYRTLQELTHAFPDCRVQTDESHAMLDILFPKQASNVWAQV